MEKELLEKLDKMQKKRTIKSIILITIIGLIVGSLSGVGAYAFSAKQITFTPNDKSWKVNNVSDAIDSIKFNKASNNYSTEETVVGTWIDGKPIYQKTFNMGKMPNNGTITASASNLNVDTIVKIGGIALDSTSNNARPLPHAVPDNNSDAIRVDFSNNTIRVITAANWNTYNVVVTLQYTKTTDSAVES